MKIQHTVVNLSRVVKQWTCSVGWNSKSSFVLQVAVQFTPLHILLKDPYILVASGKALFIFFKATSRYMNQSNAKRDA